MAITPVISQTPSLGTAEKTQALSKAREAETQKATETDGGKSSSQTAAKRYDTFEKNEENSALRASGIYRVGEEKNGSSKILFEKPEQTGKSAEQPTKPEAAREPETKQCTTNTDKVDAEIRKLQKEKQEIQRQLQSEQNADRRDKLAQQLQKLESELQTKDNDTYRKQHATYTFQ